MKVAIVASRYNQQFVEPLIDGATSTLRSHGVEDGDVQLLRVPGAWEIPLVASELATAGGWDALVALGVVIRGETAHFDYICDECTRGLGALARQHRLPIGFGVLTCETSEQARDRAGGKAGNKGEEAAMAVLETVQVLRRLRSASGEVVA